MGQLKKGNSFGENALLSDGQVRNLSVVALDKVKLLSLGRECILNILGKDLAKVIFRNKIRIGLRKSQIFNKLNNVIN